jgi:hypothetical protein
MKRVLGALLVAILLTLTVLGAAQAGATATIDLCDNYCPAFGCDAPLHCYCPNWTVANCPLWCDGFCL